MKTSTRSLGLLSLLFVPMVLGSCAGPTGDPIVDGPALAGTTLATLEPSETAYDAPTEPSYFDPYYSEDLYDGLWYYADASPAKPTKPAAVAVAGRPAGTSPAPDSSLARAPSVTLDLVGGSGTARAVTST